MSDYARHRGVTPASVTKAIKAGRLKLSLTTNRRGKPAIADVELADREWDSNTQRSTKQADQLAAAGIPSLIESEARIKAARAEMAALEAERRRGRLIDAEQARIAVQSDYAVVRTRLLGVPARAKHRLPHLSGDDVAALDDLIREALEELADEDVDGVDQR